MARYGDLSISGQFPDLTTPEYFRGIFSQSSEESLMLPDPRLIHWFFYNTMEEDSGF